MLRRVLIISIILSLFLLSSSHISLSSLIPDNSSTSNKQGISILSVDKEVYEVEETVEININLEQKDYSKYHLLISSSNNSYTYKGDFSPLMFFYPTEQGIYTTALVEKSTGAVYNKVSFNVIGKQIISAFEQVTSPLRTESIVLKNESESFKTIKKNESPLVENLGMLMTDKKEYFLGENVRVYVNTNINTDKLGKGQISLYHVFEGVEKKYMGEMSYISFSPIKPGLHRLVLRDNEDNALASYTFEVKPPINKGLVRLIDSKGLVSEADAVVLKDENGFNSIEVILNSRINGLKSIIMKKTNLEINQVENLSLRVEQLSDESVARIRIPFKSINNAFALDPASLNFSEGVIKGVALGTELWKCAQWDYYSESCLGSWVKIMDLTPGVEYSLVFNTEDPGFVETSPSTGTPDIGNVINLANINYIDGSVTDTWTDNDVFWAAGVDNPANRRYDPQGYLNMTYNISALGLSSPQQIFDLTFNISYCHTSDTTTPTACSALGTAVTYLNAYVQVLNYSSGAYTTIGNLPLRNGVEGMNNYLLNYTDYNFSHFVNNNLVNIRYGINFSIASNGYDALLAVDYAPLTIRFDKIAPVINFVHPTENSSTYLNRNYILVNVSAEDSNLKNITIYLYNATGYLVSSSYTSSASFLFANFTALNDGLYYFNATAYDSRNNFNYTITRNVTIDTIYPKIAYSTGTEQNNTYFNRNWVFINVSVNESNEQNITFRLYSPDSETLLNSTTLSAGNRNINFTNLDSNREYWYDVVVIDKAGLENSTEKRKITLDSIHPSVFLLSPSNESFINTGIAFFNYTPIDNNLASCVLYANFTGAFEPNISSNFLINNSVNTLGPVNVQDGKYLWNVWCNDSAGNSNLSQYNRTLKVDTQKPLISNWNVNITNASINSYVCLNVSVADTFSGVELVYAEIITPDLSVNNLTMFDEGNDCDSALGDGVYSLAYYLDAPGNYTWLNTHAKDYAGNWKTNQTNLSWQAITSGSMNVSMLSPTADIRINESEYNNKYQQICSARCNAGGLDCDEVILYAQYMPYTLFVNINTTTTDLVNEEDFFFCGNLVSGGSACTHAFNITSGSDSGNNTWLIRCMASTTNIGSFVSSPVNLTINDHPFASFTYPLNNSWLAMVEMLNASASFDSDGVIINYLFEYDNESSFLSSRTICNTSSNNCTWNTSLREECEDNTLSCFLRLTVTDNDGLRSNSYLRVGFDTEAPSTILGFPRDSENISTDSFRVNASAIDYQSGVDTVVFEYRYNNTDYWRLACQDSIGPVYDCDWDIKNLSDGNDYEFRAYANDSKGNIGVPDIHVNIRINRSAPVVELISPPDDSVDTDGSIIFTYKVFAFNPITNCSLIINNMVNQTNTSVERGVEQYFYLSGISDGAQLNWSVNCTDIYNRSNSSPTWNVSISISYEMNLSVSLNKSEYYVGENILIRHNVTDSTGASIANANISSSIILGNTSVPWWNTSWLARKQLILNTSSTLTDAMVEVNITGLAGNITSCANEIRIVRFNSSTATLSLINRTVVEGDDSSYCVVRFRANITAGIDNLDFMAYYNNPSATNPNNDEARRIINSTFVAIGGSIIAAAGGYNVVDGSYWNTTTDDGAYYAVGRDNGPGQTNTLNAYINLSYNISSTGAKDDELVSLNFSINYCYSSDITPPITCTGTIAGSANNPVSVQAYDFDSPGWSSFSSFNQDISSASEKNNTFNTSTNPGRFVDNTTRLVFVRYETNISPNKATDASFAIDYAVLKVFYYEKVYALGRVGEAQRLIASNESSTNYAGLWNWNWSSIGINPGNYSVVALATKTGYNNDYSYASFKLLPDTSAPVIRLISPLNNNYTRNTTIRFYFNVSDENSEIANCSLIINNTIVNTSYNPLRNVSLYLSATLSEGRYSWLVNCSDINGNTNSSETRNITIDITGPLVVLDKPMQGEVINAVSNGFIYYVNASANDLGIGVISTVTFIYRRNNTDSWKLACRDNDTLPPFNCGWNLSGLIYGNTYEVRVYANDSLGNIGNNDTHTNITLITANISITSVMVDDEILIPIDQIDLQAGTTKSVYCNITVVESEAYANILGVNATLYSISVGRESLDNNRTHYTNTSCAFITGGGFSADYQCIFNVWHFAINGTWECTAFAWNNQLIANKSDNTTINQLFALNISTSVIDYKDLGPGEYSHNVTVDISNVGNMPMNVSVYGFGGDNESNGTGLAMVCEINNISVSFERFSTIPNDTYESKKVLASTPQSIGLTIPPKVSVDDVKINSTYWQFMVPPESRALGQCNGSVVFVAESP